MRSKWIDSVATGLALCLSAANPASAQQDFQWRGRLSVGQTIEIKGINGDVRATASTSGEVEVTAARSARRSNPDEVRIEVVPHAGASPSAPSIQHLPAANRIGASRETEVESNTRTTIRSYISTCAFPTASGSSGGR